MNKSIFLASCISMFIASEAFALQKYEFNEEKRVEGNISLNELNRIKIEGDRIKQVIGLSKNYVVEGDAQNGQIFIKSVTGENKGAAIFSIITEAGRTQDFKLVPKNIAAETIIIEGYMKTMTGASRDRGIKHEKHSEIIDALKKAAAKRYENKLIEKTRVSGLEGRLISSQKVEGFWIDVWDVNNSGNEEISINEKGFAAGKANVYGVGAESISLQPGEVTRVYVIRQK